MRIFFGLILALILVSSAYADTVYLKNGRRIEGIVKSDNNQAVELEVGLTSSVTFSKSDIEKIIKSSAAEASALRQGWDEHKLEADKKIAQLQAEKEKKPSAVDFSRDTQGILVDVVLNDKVSARMVLDTGASLVMITRDVAWKLGMDLYGVKPDSKAQVADGRQVNVKHIILRSMGVQGVSAKNVEAVVLLDDAGNLSFGDGLLGMSFLKRFNFNVDSKAKSLTLQKL